MIRFNDWEQRLAVYLEELRLRPFAWGVHDCCTFSSGAVEAMTGVDPMAEFRGRYRTKRGSAVALGRIGKGTLVATMDAKLEAVEPPFAHRGDIIMVGGGLGLAMGASAFQVGCDENDGREGLILRPRHLWTHAWRVPMPGTTA